VISKTLCAVLAGGTLALSIGAAQAATPAQLDANKKIAADMMIALQHQNVAACAELLDDGYIQHNPNVPTGKVGFVDFFSRIWKAPTPGNDWVDPPVLVTAEDDIVHMTFKRNTPEPGDPSKTYESFWWDTFRIKDGKIVEHWDPATKPVPKAS